MEIWKHAVLSLIIAAVFYPAYGWNVLFIFAVGVLIDIDHYFWYIYKFKKFNLLECYKYYMKSMLSHDFREHYGILLVFHTIEFMLLMVIMSIYNKYALLFTIGLVGHYALDFIWHILVPKQVIINHSVISWVLKNIIQKV